MSDSRNLNFIQEYWIDAWQRSILSLDVLRQRGNTYLEQSAKNAPNVLSFAVRAGARRAHPAAAGQLHAGAHRPAGRDRDRPGQAAVRGGRPARRSWPRHRRHEAGQRDRRRPGGRPSLLLRRLPAEPDARARRSRMSARPKRLSCEEVARAASRSGGQAGDRQLPGRLADHDDGRDPPGAVRADHARRLAAVLLGGRARPQSDALSRRHARRHLDDGAGGRSRQRRLRRRQPRRQFRIAESGEHLLGKGLRRSIRRSTPRRPASSTSRPGGAARCCSTPTRCSGSPTICSSATSSPPARSHTSDGVRVDLRNIRSPIVVFCSWGDNITPPQQALGWVTDLYDA